jgi:hypothetical protein
MEQRNETQTQAQNIVALYQCQFMHSDHFGQLPLFGPAKYDHHNDFEKLPQTARAH